MITTLKITTFLAALICVSLVGFVGAFGLKGDSDIEKFIAEPSFVDGLKKGNSNTKADSDEMLPLVREAQLFAKRINPPPPPRPPKPVRPEPGTKRQIVRNAPPPEPPKPQSAKFDVIAMCRYEDDPGKSMALINLRPKGLKWVRVGENVEHLVVVEITDDGVIMSHNGRRQDPITMKQTPSIVRSLLASDAETAAPAPIGMVYSPATTTSSSSVPPRAGAPLARKSTAYVPPKAGVVTSATTRRPPITRPTTTRKPPVTPISRQPRTYTRGAGSRTTRRPQVPTTEELKAMLDGNISEIKKLISKPTPGTPKDEKAEGVDALSKLLKLLEKERKEIKQPPKNATDSTAKASKPE